MSGTILEVTKGDTRTLDPKLLNPISPPWVYYLGSPLAILLCVLDLTTFFVRLKEVGTCTQEGLGGRV